MATIENALAAAPAFGMRGKDAGLIIEQIRVRVRDWRDYYAACGLTELDIQKISSCFYITDT